MNVYVRELSRELASRGVEVDVFTRRRKITDPPVQTLAPNARVIHIEAGPVRYITKAEVFERIDEFTEKVQSYVRDEGRVYDLIHSHYWLSAVVARELAARWRLPTVQMFHTLGLVKREVMDEDVDGESDTRIEIERRAVRESDAIVAASEIEATELEQLYGARAEKIAVIPCGVDPDLFRPQRQADARSALGRDQCERLVLFVGRIEQIKGINVLLNALGFLFRRRPELRGEVCLVVVGGALDANDDAPETDKIVELRRLVHEHRMEDSVDFVGSVDQQRLALWYAAADLCAVPSLTESFGLVALEAMACGTPVVATRVGGLQTVVEEGRSGLLVPAGDDQVLAEAIEKVLLDHRLRMHLAHGARERAEGFTWSRVADGVESLYQRVLDEHRVRVEV
jgi:D-inositol-3-phosphate glycosyltransferase